MKMSPLALFAPGLRMVTGGGAAAADRAAADRAAAGLAAVPVATGRAGVPVAAPAEVAVADRVRTRAAPVTTGAARRRARLGPVRGAAGRQPEQAVSLIVTPMRSKGRRG